MSFIRIIGLAMTALAANLILKQIKSEYSFLVSVLITAFFCTFSLSLLSPVIEYINELLGSSENSESVTILFKSTGIGIITSIASDMCKDLGEVSLGSKLELCGKCLILSLSLPLIKELINIAVSIVK